MGNLTVRVYHLGTCREYFFTGSGPYTVGGLGSDILLESIAAPALQIKLSGGKIYLHRISDEEVSLAHKILPLRSEVAYNNDEDIELEGYQIKLSLPVASEDVPPPFFKADIQHRVDDLKKKIINHQAELKGLQTELTSKEKQITGVTTHLLDLQKDKHHFELIIDQLKVEKRAIEGDLSRQKEYTKIEADKLKALNEDIGTLSTEKNSIQHHIQKLQLDLRQFKSTHEEKDQEIHRQQNALSDIYTQIEEAKKQLININTEASDKNLQATQDQERLASVLKESQSIVEEKHRLNQTVLGLNHKKTQLQTELDELEVKRTNKESLIRGVQDKIDSFKKQAQIEEDTLNHIKRSITEKLDEEVRLKSVQEVIRLESQKLEAEFARRRGQYAGLEADHQKAHKELSQLEYQAEDCQKRINHLIEEEHKQQYKLQGMRKEAEATEARLDLETKKAQAEFHNLQKKLQFDIQELREKLESLQLATDEYELKIKHCKDEFEKWHKATTGIKIEKSELEAQLSGLQEHRAGLENSILNIKSQLENYQREKVLKEHEMHDLNFKLHETQSQMRIAEEESALEIQNRKREFEQKILVDRELLLAEVELIKKKTLNEIEEEKRHKIEEIQLEKQEALRRSEALINEAHRESDRLMLEARERLKAASLEAQEREAKAHTRFMEAQELYNQKQAESQSMMNQAHDEAGYILKRAEEEIQTEYSERRNKMKAYLTKKQNKTINGLTKLTDIHLQKLARVESRSMLKIDTLKRKELKKVSELREAEMSKHQEMRDKFALEMREERKRAFQQLKKVKEDQERELSEAKKLALQNLSQSKQRTLEEAQAAIQREKQQFENTKDQRLQNATRSVLKLISGQLPVPENFEQQLKNSLQQALEGKFSVATQTGEKILDFNPLKQKAVLPVLQKYALRVGLPVAVALVLTLDVASVRTGMVNLAKTALQQKESAAEKFVQQQKEEWKEKNTFNPDTTPEYKATYVDNVLYTTDFVTVVEQEAYQNDWILKLHDYITRELELSEDVAIGYISSEGALLKELSLARGDIHPSFKEQGIKKMQDLETTHLGWLGQKVTDPAKLQKLTDFRKNFYEDYYQKQFKANRSMASEPTVSPAPTLENVIAPVVKP